MAAGMLQFSIVCGSAISDGTECATMPIPPPLRPAGSTMLEVRPRDKRGFFILPQASEGAGYYVYGNLHRMPHSGHMAQYGCHRERGAAEKEIDHGRVGNRGQGNGSGHAWLAAPADWVHAAAIDGGISRDAGQRSAQSAEHDDDGWCAGALLSRPSASSSSTVQIGARVARSTATMTTMVNDLLEFARTQLGGKFARRPSRMPRRPTRSASLSRAPRAR